MDVHAVVRLESGGELAGGGHGLGRLVHRLLRHLKSDVDAGRVPLVGDEKVTQSRLLRGDLGDFAEPFRGEIETPFHKIGDDEVVLGGGGVLVVGDGVDAQDVGQLPGFDRKKLDGVEDLGSEDGIIPGSDGEEDVVDLRVGALELLEGEQLGVVIGEEDAVVVVEGETGSAGAGDGGEGEGSDQDEPAPADDPFGEGAGGAVAVFWGRWT